jgi:hypothetical protein
MPKNNVRKNNKVMYAIVAAGLALIIVIAPLSSFATVINANTPQEQTQARALMQSTQDLTTLHLTSDEQNQGGTFFSIRWGEVEFIGAGQVALLFADCNPGEFAVSGLKILGNKDLHDLESYPLALPDNSMTWLTVIESSASSDTYAASTGVVCADDGKGGETKVISDETRNVIKNSIKIILKSGNVNIFQLNQVIQNIFQTAVQIINVTGNNNTVNAVINQSANQIANLSASQGGNLTAGQINQIINQTASQTVASNATNVNQTIGQAANQTAASNATNVNQTIGQAANQTALVGDTTPPVITVPEDITEEATGPDGAQVSFEVSADDDVDGPVDVTCDHNSGERFPIGETVVRCTAEDSAGNTAEESFTITVEQPADDGATQGNSTEA